MKRFAGVTSRKYTQVSPVETPYILYEICVKEYQFSLVAVHKCMQCLLYYVYCVTIKTSVHTQLSSFIHSVSCYLQCNFCDLRHFVTQVKMMSFSVCFTCLIFFLSLCRNCYQYCCHCSRITNPVHAVDFGAAVFSRVIIQNFN